MEGGCVVRPGEVTECGHSAADRHEVAPGVTMCLCGRVYAEGAAVADQLAPVSETLGFTGEPDRSRTYDSGVEYRPETEDDRARVKAEVDKIVAAREAELAGIPSRGGVVPVRETFTPARVAGGLSPSEVPANVEISGRLRRGTFVEPGPFLASDFLERALELKGKLGLHPNPFGDPVGVGEPDRELSVVAPFEALGRLFALAALDDVQGPLIRRAQHEHGLSEVVLGWDNEGPHRVNLLAYVCYQPGDGFDVGVNVRDVRTEDRAADPTAPAGHNSQALRLVPGTALFVLGGVAVGVGGWVDGVPVLVMAPEGHEMAGADFIHDKHGAVGALSAAIVGRFCERVR